MVRPPSNCDCGTEVEVKAAQHATPSAITPAGGLKLLVGLVFFLALYLYGLEYNSIQFGHGVHAGMRLQADIQAGRYASQEQAQKAINDLTRAAVNPPFN